MSPYLPKYCRLLTGFFSAIALTATSTLILPVFAQLSEPPVEGLPKEEQAALRSGQVVLSGEDGKYTARMLVTASMDTVWEVLTDYNNFENFIPSIDRSELLESNGNRKVFEQVNIIDAFIFSKKARMRIAVTETSPKQIAFSVIEGDLDSLDGVWQLEPVSSSPGGASDRVLLTHQVNVDPGSSSPRDLFFVIYQEDLLNTLEALKQEMNKRYAKK